MKKYYYLSKMQEEIEQITELYNSGLIGKIKTFHQLKITGVGVKAKKSDTLEFTEKRIQEPVKFKITKKEDMIFKRLSSETGLSRHQVACYFMVVGLEKEFSKERDKFDMAAKVKRTYQNTLDAKTEEIKLLLSSELSDFRNEMRNDMKALRKESSIFFILLMQIGIFVRTIYRFMYIMEFRKEAFETESSLEEYGEAYKKKAERELTAYLREMLEKNEIKNQAERNT